MVVAISPLLFHKVSVDVVALGPAIQAIWEDEILEHEDKQNLRRVSKAFRDRIDSTVTKIKVDARIANLDELGSTLTRHLMHLDQLSLLVVKGLDEQACQQVSHAMIEACSQGRSTAALHRIKELHLTGRCSEPLRSHTMLGTLSSALQHMQSLHVSEFDLRSHLVQLTCLTELKLSRNTLDSETVQALS